MNKRVYEKRESDGEDVKGRKPIAKMEFWYLLKVRLKKKALVECEECERGKQEREGRTPELIRSLRLHLGDNLCLNLIL